MFVGFIVLIVLVALCAVLGAIYGYIYFTRINPARARKYVQTACDQSSDEPGGAGTHLFLFRKATT